MSAKGIPGGLRVGQVKGQCKHREVKLAYGRNWEWKGGGRMEDGPWGGVEILPRVMASHFAQDFIRVLTGQEGKELPQMLLGEGIGSVRWERKIGEWVYFVSLEWAAGERPLKLELSPRAELALGGHLHGY